jgi:hypothetical protein
MISCRLCQRKANEKGEFCTYHLAAMDALVSGYDSWKEAYSDLTWLQYLTRVKQLKGTGEWVNEVIEFEMKKQHD